MREKRREEKGERTIWRILREERAQDAALRRAERRVVERVYERRHTEHVREEDKLLAEWGAYLAGAREKLDCSHPFVRRDATVRHASVKLEGIVIPQAPAPKGSEREKTYLVSETNS